MDRRKFIAAIGSLAAGGAAATGTGAFTSAQANRTVSINVVGDSSAYLALSEGPNSDVANDVVSNNGGEYRINLDGDGTKASGLNQDATTQFANILTVTNQGTTDVHFGVDTSAINSKSGIDDFNVFAHNYADGSPEYDGKYWDKNDGYPAQVTGSVDSSGEDPLITLSPGDSVDLSISIDTNGQAPDSDLSVPFIAVEDGGRNDNRTVE